MKIQKIPFLFLSLIMIGFLCSFNVVKPIEKPKKKTKMEMRQHKSEMRQQKRVARIKSKIAKAKNQKHKMRLQKRLDNVNDKNRVKTILGIIGMSLGILALIFIFVWANPIIFIIGLAFSVIGLVFSILGIGSERKGFGIAGTMISGTALLLGLIFLSFLAIIIAALF